MTYPRARRVDARVFSARDARDRQDPTETYSGKGRAKILRFALGTAFKLRTGLGVTRGNERVGFRFSQFTGFSAVGLGGLDA